MKKIFKKKRSIIKAPKHDRMNKLRNLSFASASTLKLRREIEGCRREKGGGELCRRRKTF